MCLCKIGLNDKVQGHNIKSPVTSLELVLPGAAIDDVTPIFHLKNWRPFLVIAPKWRPFTFFSCRLVTTPQQYLHNYHLPTSCCPVFFVSSATFFFIRVSPPGWCHPRRSPLFPLVTPLFIINQAISL